MLPYVRDSVIDMGGGVVLALTIAYLCRHEVKALSDKWEDAAWLCVFVCSAFVQIGVNLTAKEMGMKTDYLNTISAENARTVGRAHYLQVDSLCPDTAALGSYWDFTVRNRRYHSDVYMHLYTAVRIKNTPNVFVGMEVSERLAGGFASDDELDRMAREMAERHGGDLKNISYDAPHRLRRIRRSDNYEGFEKAISNSMGNTRDAIVFEISDNDTPHHPARLLKYCLPAFVVTALLLLFIYSCSYVSDKQYRESKEKRHVWAGGWRVLKKPYMWLLVGIPLIMVTVSLLMVGLGYNPDASNYEMLTDWGSLNAQRVTANGEWWRLVTSVFVHDGLFHLAGNVAGYAICMAILFPFFDARKLFVVFMISAVGASICCLLFSTHNTTGASGGVFGLYGFMLVAAYRLGKGKKGQTIALIWFPIIMIAVNLIYSFQNFVSMSAHVGGLVVGGVLGMIIDQTEKKERTAGS